MSISASPAAAQVYLDGCQTASGYVRDVAGEPIAGVDVTVLSQNTCEDENGRSDASGFYSVRLEGTDVDGKIVRFTKTGYGMEVPSINWVPGSVNDVQLLFEPVASIDPDVVLPGGTVTIEVVTLAPPPGSPSTTDFRVHADYCDITQATPPCDELPMSPGATDAQGLTAWSAQWVVPTTTGGLEPTYVFDFCVVVATFAEGCYEAASQGFPPAASEYHIGDRHVRVDLEGPYIASTGPRRFGTRDEVDAVWVQWSDQQSYVEETSTRIWIDGIEQTGPSVHRSGGLIQAPATGLAEGVHLVESSARDIFGHESQGQFMFVLAAGDAEGGTAHIDEKTQLVNPNAKIPPPTAVRFSGSVASISGFTEDWAALGGSGHGQVWREVDFVNYRVRFENELGRRQTVSVPAPAVSTTHRVASLGPSAGPVRATIDPTSIGLPDIVVAVPSLEYATNGSTATLLEATVALGPPQSGWELLDTPLAERVPVTASIGACLERRSDGGQPTTLRCEADAMPRVGATIAGQTVPVFFPVSAPVDADDENAREPVCSAAAGGSGCANPFDPGADWVDFGEATLAFGCPTYSFPEVGPLNLCTLGTQPSGADGYLGAYLNTWVFGDPSGGFPVWQQDHLDPGSEPCPDGRSGSVTGSVYRAAASTRAFDGAVAPVVGGTFKRNAEDTRDPQVRLGSLTRATAASGEAQGAVGATTSLGYQISPANLLLVRTLPAHAGHYRVLSGSWVDGLGQAHPDPAATASFWGAHDPDDPGGAPSLATDSTASLVSQRLQLLSGTHFTSPSPLGGYGLLTRLDFQFVADFSACGLTP